MSVSMGGVEDVLVQKNDGEVARTGLSVDEIGRKVHILREPCHAFRILYLKILRHTAGKLIPIPSLPAIYNYEFPPQKVWHI